MRCIHIDPIGHPGRSIKPVLLIDLLASGGRDQHVVPEVGLIKVHPKREPSIGFGEQRRHTHRLLDHHVGGAGDLSQPSYQFTGKLMVGIDVRTIDLYIDRRERAEI